MAALGTGRGFGARLLGVEMIAADAVERDLASLGIVQGPVAPVVVDPQHGKHAQGEQAVQHYIEGEIRRRNHAGTSHEDAVRAKAF